MNESEMSKGIDYNALAAALRSEGLSDEDIAWILYLDVEDVEGLA